MATMDKTNKYGLSRYISECVKEKIRKDAGYGCVFCGSLIIQYEHIEPEFSNAQIHDPEKMTLLCASCHFKVTKKLISKKAVWDAKSSPRAKQKGFVNDFIYHDCDNATIQFGSSKISMSNIVLEAYGKPLLWFEKSNNKDEPFKLCCVFYDKESNPIAFINRNEFIGIVENYDIKSVGTKIEIQDKIEGSMLNLSCEGGEILRIISMNMNYLNLSVKINKDGVILAKIGKSSITIKSGAISNCDKGIVFASNNKIKELSAILIAVKIAFTNAKKVHSYNGDFIAWVLGSSLVNSDYLTVASISNLNVFSPSNEFIGILKNGTISMGSEQYESGEPIWVSPMLRNIFNVKIDGDYDLTHRISE